ncbi:MAG: hypothetical protein FWD31_13365 [Planctomycetaceae bacterium]|nr:hypothetical protein [Planctomycetaceae bacterium]
MKRPLILAVAAVVFCFALAPEQASAQLFRGWQDNNFRSNFSNLPGADPNARRAPDYGAELVSEEIRNEVNGRAPVSPAPDFFSDAPLARIAKQYLNPVGYTTHRPFDTADRLRQPRSKYNGQVAFGPHWMLPYSEAFDHGNPAPSGNGRDFTVEL